MKTQKLRLVLVRSLMVALPLVIVSGGSLQAQTGPDSPEAVELDSQATSNEAAVADKVSGKFSDLAGSDENARALVKGLREGSDVTLSTSTGEGTPPATNTFTPKTGKLGYGNVYIALGLAKESLAQAGVTNPTAAELEAALNGGTVTVGTGETAKTTTLSGVLTLRAGGMGWGQIAKQYDVKLGRVISDLRRDSRSLERAGVRPEKPTKPERAERPERPEKPERPERPEKPERPERPEKTGRP